MLMKWGEDILNVRPERVEDAWKAWTNGVDVSILNWYTSMKYCFLQLSSEGTSSFRVTMAGVLGGKSPSDISQTKGKAGEPVCC